MPDAVFDGLYRFTALNGQMNLPVNQYLLATEPSVMFATGSYDQATWILPQIKEVLNGRDLDYLFISHCEADELGGVRPFLKKYPHLKILCSAFTASQIRGYGIKADIVICDGNSVLKVGGLEFRFIRYPSEVHLQDGLLVVETTKGIFYSADLFPHRIQGMAKIINSEWEKEVESIGNSHIPVAPRCDDLKNQLLAIRPSFIATGHGPSIDLRTD